MQGFKSFSIVIPHKNTPDLLKRCLSSIPIRNDLEIIIVDDNSNPSIVNFDSFPGKDRCDTRIIFDKTGCGAGNARNIGLKRSCGFWVYFVDADDFLTEKFNDILNKYSTIRDIDMVFFNAVSFDENNIKKKLIVNRYINNYIKKRPLSLNVLRFQYWPPWSRMIRRDLLIENDIWFEEIPVSNDAWAILNASLYAKSFNVEPMVVYNYFKPSYGSQTNKAYNIESDILRLEQRFKINNLYSIAGYPFKWPIKYSFKKILRSEDHRILDIKTQYHYNPIKDYIRLQIYYIGKVIKFI